MSKTNETPKATGPLQFRVNYQYPAKGTFQLRGGTVVVEAANATEANEKALGLLKDTGLENYRLTSTKPY